MSKIRKHVTEQLLYSLPEPTANQAIVKVLGVRGTNQIEVEYPHGEKVLVMLPSKFRKLLWIKKKDYLIISTGTNTALNTGKIKGIVEHKLMKNQIRHLQQKEIWPKEFESVDLDEEGEENEQEEEDVDVEEEDDFEMSNPNRQSHDVDSEEEEEVEEEEEENME